MLNIEAWLFYMLRLRFRDVALTRNLSHIYIFFFAGGGDLRLLFVCIGRGGSVIP